MRMTQTSSNTQSERDTTKPRIDAKLFADEIRIAQSVNMQANLPLLVLGNAMAIGMVIATDWDGVFASRAIYLLAPEAILLLPMARSYQRIHGRPRPERVSKRRIRNLEIYSLIMGLVWSLISVLMMSQASPATGVSLFSILSVLCFGGVLMMPTLPKAVLAYSVTLAIANAAGTIYFQIDGFWYLIFLCGGGLIVIFRAIWINWQQTKSNVRLRIESVEAEAERSRMMEQVSTRLSKYISPQLYQSIFSGEQKVEIASKRKKLTIFFSDIAGFAEITNQLESEELTAVLNRYLTEMSNIAVEYGATIDKFVGDAIVVYFGDPQTRGVKEDADQCVKMAITMRERVNKLGPQWIDMGLERPLTLRIGINTGYCTVGNFGSQDRMDYTIIGSEVNLAARLESAADVGDILLANETYSLVRDWVATDEFLPITVKGFPRPVKTFRVKGIKNKNNGITEVFQRDLSGLALTIDRSGMDQADAENAERALKEALAHLREAGGGG
jgi:adenylate cyclase